MLSSYAALALTVARCPEVSRAALDSSHPCSKVVRFQDAYAAPFQVPEAWAGRIETARVLFLSSNPSISGADQDAKAAHRRLTELYPTMDWDDTLIADFMTRRFDSTNEWVNENLQHLKQGGNGETADEILRRAHGGEFARRGIRENYWSWIQEQTRRLVGDENPWYQDAVMTEVVHCKSKKEHGVREAARHCSNVHMERVLSACPAGLVVVVGSRAKDALLLSYSQLANLYPRFGRDEANGRPDLSQNIFSFTIGGRQRTFCFLWHRQSWGSKIKDLAALYPEDFPRLQESALRPHPISS